MNKQEWEEHEQILTDGLRFYLQCLDDTSIPHPEIKPRTAQYLHDTYNVGVLRAITLAHRVQGRFAVMQEEIKNIPW